MNQFNVLKILTVNLLKFVIQSFQPALQFPQILVELIVNAQLEPGVVSEMVNFLAFVSLMMVLE